MTKVVTTLISLTKGSVDRNRDRLVEKAEELGVGVETHDYEPLTPTHLKNSIEKGDVPPTKLWVYDIPTDIRWNFHGESCRLIIERGDNRPKIHGRVVKMMDRYRSGVTDTITGMNYAKDVTAILTTEAAPPAVVHSAPFSYDPYHHYYTEIHRETTRQL